MYTYEAHMIRTQVYITQQEKKALSQIADHTGSSQSELIRQAIDLLCKQHAHPNRMHFLKSARGIWKNRADKYDYISARKEIDREFNRE